MHTHRQRSLNCNCRSETAGATRVCASIQISSGAGPFPDLLLLILNLGQIFAAPGQSLIAGMTTLNEMKEVLKEQLEKNGSLNEIRAKLMSEIFNSLNNNPKQGQNLSNQNLLINELIREYLVFNNYNYTNSVLVSEAGQPARPVDRSIVASQLNLMESSESRQLPLLYSVVFGLKSRAEEYEPPVRQRSPEHDIGRNLFSVDQSKGFEVRKGK